MAGTISTICEADFEHVNGGCLACIGQRQCSSLNMAPKMTLRGHFTDAAGDTSPDMLPKSANANLTKWFLPSFCSQPPFVLEKNGGGGEKRSQPRCFD